MNDSENNGTKIIIGIIVAIVAIIAIIYAYSMFKGDSAVNDIQNGANQMGQDIANGTQNLVDGAGEAASDMANGVENAVDKVIDFTMMDNATVENNTKTNTSEKIRENKKYENLVFKEVTIIGRDNVSTFTAKIKNESDTNFKSKDVKITLFKKDGTTISTMTLNIPDINAMETTEVTLNVKEDIANAYDYTIE